MQYVIIDIETTGGNPKNSKITEIAMYKVENNQVIDEFVTLVNPEIPIPYFIVRLTGISDQMVRNAPTFPEIAKKIIDFTEGCIFVAHNVGFDYSMVRAEFKSLGYTYARPTLCTVKLGRVIIPGHKSYSLGNITKDLGIYIDGRHRAGGDAFATVQLFQLLHTKSIEIVQRMISRNEHSKDLHPKFDQETIQEIPAKTGVYLFYNEFNQIIYIGKSKHIRKRVIQHLGNTKTKKGSKMRAEITRIEFELTGSEVVALLRESQLIKKHTPIYNRKLRKNLFPLGLFNTTDEKGYIQLEIGNLSKKNQLPITVFQSLPEAKKYLHSKVKQYKLCQKLTQLYPTQNECFGYQINECKGACIEKETTEEYNERVSSLINTLKFNQSDFIIIEQGRTKTEKAVILVQNESYRGFSFIPANYLDHPFEKWEDKIAIEKEDRDAKQIIQSYLRHCKSPRILEV
ncbi:MAG: exonuclease domain-containing protein [Crocinitomicaceae bacterium]|jgi:DNA polymerase-3 subunit epsilon